MSFSRYPISGKPPLKLAGGEVSDFIPFTPHIGLKGGLNHMVIHLAASVETTTPQLDLWVNGAEPSTAGGAFTVPYSETGGFSTLPDATGRPIGAAFMRQLPALVDGTLVRTIYQVNMLLFGTEESNWHLRITNTDASPQQFTWVVADSEAEAEQPWLNVTTPTLSFHAQRGQPFTPASQALEVTNLGTGMMTVAGLEDGSTIAPHFRLGLLPRPIPPGRITEIPVEAAEAPTEAGVQEISASLALVAAKPDNDATTIAGHSKQFTIITEVRTLIAPTLTAIDPPFQTQGNNITIIGSGFDRDGLTVTFVPTDIFINPEAGALVSSTPEQIIVTVPTFPTVIVGVPIGECNIRIQTADGTVESDQAVTPFTVLTSSKFTVSPTLTAIDPPFQTLGNPITIMGSGFDEGQPKVTFIPFNSVVVSEDPLTEMVIPEQDGMVVSSTATQLVVTVPDFLFGFFDALQCRIRVQTAGGTVESDPAATPLMIPVV
jgi:hypothetical protein